MMSKDRFIIWCALVISICVHLFILLPGLVQASSPAKPAVEETPLNKSEFKRKMEEEEEEEIKLGIDESEASTLTWIGYKEYQEHLARLAKVEQAELQAASAMPVSGGAPAAPDRPQVTPQQPVEPTPQTAQPVTESAQQPAQDQTVASNAPPAETTPAPASSPESVETSQAPPPPGGLRKLPEGQAPPGETINPEIGAETKKPEEDLPKSPDKKPADPAQNPKTAEAPASTEKKPKPESPTEQTKPDKPTPEKPKPDKPKPPVKPTPPVQPSKPGPGGTAGEGPPAPDSSAARDETDPNLPPKPDAAKSDSQATSTIKVPLKDWKKGKPIAAQGLRLYPRRPTFTALQGVTNGGSKTILVRFEFGSNGKPAKVTLVRGSGNPALDRTFKASFYQWRASGKQLKTLKKKEFVPVQLEIILTVN
ncbi:MAG: hypothetical protein VX527_05070 [Planctomycetota bacterium]|nr:hypothetical protein [Planctomycetota bacterium]